MSNDGLQVQTSAPPSRQRVVVSAVGDVDMVGGKQIVRDFHAAVRNAVEADIEIDLADVTFVDSSAISAPLLCHRQAATEGHPCQEW